MSRNLTIAISITYREKEAISHIVKSLLLEDGRAHDLSKCLRYTITNGEINCLFLDDEVQNIIKTLKSELAESSCYGRFSLDDMRKLLEKFEKALGRSLVGV